MKDSILVIILQTILDSILVNTLEIIQDNLQVLSKVNIPQHILETILELQVHNNLQLNIVQHILVTM